MVYVKNGIREMFQKTYVIRDLNANRLVIRDRDPPFTTLTYYENVCKFADFVELWLSYGILLSDQYQ